MLASPQSQSQSRAQQHCIAAAKSRKRTSVVGVMVREIHYRDSGRVAILQTQVSAVVVLWLFYDGCDSLMVSIGQEMALRQL